MKQTRLTVFGAALITGAFLVFVFARAGFHDGRGTASANAVPGREQSTQPAPTLAVSIDRQLSRIEELILNVADAMPEDKFNFTPESLKVPGSDYKGVLTFAGQVKHVAAGNYFIWSAVTGDKLPEGLFNDGRGPDNLKSKAEIIQFLKDSFALGHRAAATVTPENMLQSAGKSTRISSATFVIAEAYNHYGQMVEYLRMSGIIPPASRAKSD